MSEYTFRLAHLDSTSLKTGDTVSRGNALGVMGNTGQSTGPHGHIDVVTGRCDHLYRLHEIDKGYPRADFEELQYFIDSELVGGYPFRITTYVYDYRYKIKGKWKAHPAYDIVIDSSNPVFYWNRSFKGEVVAVGKDRGYGIYVQIYYSK